MKPQVNINGPWGLHDHSDTNCEGYEDNRKIVTLYDVLINWLVVTCNLRGQESVTITVSEAEYSSVP